MVLSIKEALIQAKTNKGSGVFGHCLVCAILKDLEKEDREALDEAIKGKLITRPEIQRILLEHGYSVSLTTLSTHRNRCYRGEV